MPVNTKITFSDAELVKLRDKDWILTKHIISGRMGRFLNEQVPVINHFFEPVIRQHALQELISIKPKFSKGENYLGLPYQMLDYPALFSKEEVFALRTLFWWGNFISITLQVSGKYKNAFEQKLLTNIRESSLPVYACISEDPWLHHFEENNYQQAAAVDDAALLSKNFLKLAFRFNLEQMNEMPLLLADGYEKFSGLLK